ncbi:MAG: zinc ribbon domain-containing protein [Steroidobacteraceae bacterium]
MRTAAVTGIHVFVPRLRLARSSIAAATAWANPQAAKAKGSRSICNWDEDALTMAVAAARGAMGNEHSVDALWLASTTLPFADRSNAALVGEALDLDPAHAGTDVTGSLRAGTGALLRAIGNSCSGAQLVIASDARKARPASPEELKYGHGAVALRIEATADPLAQLLGSAELSADFVDHYRGTDADFDYTLEERWVRDEGLTKLIPAAVDRALAAASLQRTDLHAAILPGGGAMARAIARAAKLGECPLTPDLAADVGDCGAAQPLMMLAAALDAAQPGQNILLVGFGQGVDALVLRSGGAAALARKSSLNTAISAGRAEEQYVRYLSHAGIVDVDFGMRAERDNRSAQSTAWRRHRDVNGFVGGRCSACQAVQFPRARVCVNPECRATDTQQPYRLANSRGRVKTFTEDWQAYSPRPPYIYGNVAFEEGGNLLMEFADLATGELVVGDQVSFEFRIKDFDTRRGFRRYFWKAVKS